VVWPPRWLSRRATGERVKRHYSVSAGDSFPPTWLQRHAVLVTAILAVVAVTAVVMALREAGVPDSYPTPQTSAAQGNGDRPIATCRELTESLQDAFIVDFHLKDHGTTLDGAVRNVICDVRGKFRLDVEVSVRMRILLERLDRPWATDLPAEEWPQHAAGRVADSCDGEVISRRFPSEYAIACQQHGDDRHLEYTVSVAEKDAIAYVNASALKLEEISTESRRAFEAMVWLAAQATLTAR